MCSNLSPNDQFEVDFLFPLSYPSLQRIFHWPDSCTDLHVSPRQALHLTNIDEFLRHFSIILRLSPFLFSQIDPCLFRLLIKQDEDDGISYTSITEINDIVDLSFVTMDSFT